MDKSEIEFVVDYPGWRNPKPRGPHIHLKAADWDDWFSYQTLFIVSYIGQDGEFKHLGSVKIGQKGLRPQSREDYKKLGSERRGKAFREPDLPGRFDRLDSSFFSVGQDLSYYENICSLGSGLRDQILTGLRDLVNDEKIYQDVKDEEVLGKSLLRTVSIQDIEGQFRRFVRGGDRLTDYDFTFQAGEGRNPLRLKFKVRPDGKLPTNIHVIIGRNGVGKTRFLTGVVEQMTQESRDRESEGQWKQVSSIVSVSFSAFDSVWVRQQELTDVGIRYSHVGMHKKRKGRERDSEVESAETKGGRYAVKSPPDLRSDLMDSMFRCVTDGKLDRLASAIRELENDPVFNHMDLADGLTDLRPILAQASPEDVDGFLKKFEKKYSRMSSGHKVVFLSIVKLVDLVREKTLVLFDEPEGHLHPPLLSAYIRALSGLLSESNGLAIIATHSPVVLQEVPRRCVYVLDRVGNAWSAGQPDIETFGENVGVLTGEVFGLEVTSTGFHRILREVAADSSSYDQALERMDNAVGAEGRAILRAMFATRRADGLGVR